MLLKSYIIYFFFFSEKTQSQEVTYAELSLPRNKGYAPMRSCNINAPAPNLGKKTMP